MKKILMLMLAISLISCRNKLLLLAYGIDSTPNSKSTEYVQAYIFKNKFPTTNQYLIDESAFRELKDLNKVVSQYLLYNKSGNLLTDTFQNSCTGNSAFLIENVIKNRLFSVDSSHKLNTLTSHIIDDKGVTRAANLNSSADYTIVLTWASWAGRLNQQGYLRWYNQAAAIKEKYNLEILNLNVDLLKIVKYDEPQNH